MPSMRDIKRRIRSVNNTQQITKAMKMVSAAKLRRAQEAVAAARPYSNKLQEVLARLVEASGELDFDLVKQRPVKRVGYVVITGDRGLCGGYNANVIKLTERTIRERDEDVALVVIGRKARDYFRRRNVEIERDFINIGDNPNFIQARELASTFTRMYLDGTFDEIHLVYTEFRSAMSQIPKVIQLLPIDPETKTDEVPEVEYLFEPSAREVLGTLLPRYVETVVYRVLLEAKASEHGARMTAMDSATSNAEEMIDKLTLSFNRARQAAITREISEIVGGAAALE
ncbi:MAG: F0F1 ATP synthase subunit gamma [Thermoanaerobacteraceae bacterium]|nr:F0F1 ATP synthase subunit gamma [Thermoanaerobacteraceae bacterium]